MISLRERLRLDNIQAYSLQKMSLMTGFQARLGWQITSTFITSLQMLIFFFLFSV
jgi:hypothetical protein